MATAPKPAYDFAALLSTPLEWKETGEPEFPWEAHWNGNRLSLRLNDFPEQPLYTLMESGHQLGDFDDWPPAWKR